MYPVRSWITFYVDTNLKSRLTFYFPKGPLPTSNKEAIWLSAELFWTVKSFERIRYYREVKPFGILFKICQLNLAIFERYFKWLLYILLYFFEGFTVWNLYFFQISIIRAELSSRTALLKVHFLCHLCQIWQNSSQKPLVGNRPNCTRQLNRFTFITTPFQMNLKYGCKNKYRLAPFWMYLAKSRKNSMKK